MGYMRSAAADEHTQQTHSQKSGQNFVFRNAIIRSNSLTGLFLYSIVEWLEIGKEEMKLSSSHAHTGHTQRI